jgi:hypothetical protein
MKLQPPNSKIQGSIKLQKAGGRVPLKFEPLSFPGVWSLEFGVFSP